MIKLPDCPERMHIGDHFWIIVPDVGACEGACPHCASKYFEDKARSVDDIREMGPHPDHSAEREP